MSILQTSKYISYLLRHHPETAGITLDEHGWANVNELIAGVSKTHPLTMELLEEIVATDKKGRYSFNEDKTLIRANQGHSANLNIDIGFRKLTPPDILYHGTGEKYVRAINEQGLIPKKRQYVHLSFDTDTAIKVGARHGKPVIYRVDAERMSADGFEFFISENGVWLTKTVPAEYLEIMIK